MKTIIIWTLFIAAMVPLTACHRHHRHDHRFAAGYSDLNNAQPVTQHPGAGDAVSGG